MIDAAIREFRFTARALRRSPAFTAIAVLTFGAIRGCMREWQSC